MDKKLHNKHSDEETNRSSLYKKQKEQEYDESLDLEEVDEDLLSEIRFFLR